MAASFFMGDHTRLLLNWTGGAYLTIEAKGNQSFHKGEAVAIRLEPQSLLALKG